jgi:signal transduction histidine kinase
VSDVALRRHITRQVERRIWVVLTLYAVVVVAAFAAVSELALRRTLNESADVIESLLTLYADPEGEPTTVAPAMLADQLVGMNQRFLITRAVATGPGDRALYYLSPNMPAQEIRPSPGATPGEVREQLARVITDRGRWQFRILHRRSGDFDIFVAGSRNAAALALAGLAGVALLLLPAAALAARRTTTGAVEDALKPLFRVVQDTKAIDPSDLTRRVQAETGVAEMSEMAREINQLIDRVEQSYQALEEFTADASHELRTPLTHLRAQAHYALSEDRSREEMAEALRAISNEVDQTTNMIKDLLLIARGENQQLTLTREPFELRDVVHDVEEVAEAMVTGRAVTVRVGESGAVRALGDRDRTRQVLLNVLSNAVRYTDEGTIDFTFHHENGLVGVAVADTGCGIAPDHLERIFDRFFRAERSRSRQHGGAGLGLTIARLLTELQGGRIAVTSTLGHGSTFTVWLPAAGGEADPTHAKG